MTRDDWLLIAFLVLGALGFIPLAEWLFNKVITPIGDIVNVLEWMSTLNEATPLSLLIGVITLILPVIIFKMISEYLRERFNM